MKLRRSKEKILMAVWAVMVFCGLAAGIGIFAANTFKTWAALATKRTVSDWNFNLESVLFLEPNGKYRYKEGNQTRTVTTKQNDNPFSNDGQQYIQFWQPIEEDYGLGYIALGADGLKDEHFCSSEVFFPEVSNNTRENKYKKDNSVVASLSLDWDKSNGLFRQNGLFYALPYKRPETGSNKGKGYHTCVFPFQYRTGLEVTLPTNTIDITLDGDTRGSKSLANTTAATQRNDMYFVDHYGAAQRMGKSYDVRQYYSNGYEGKARAGGEVDLDWRNDSGSASARPYASYERRHSTPTYTIFEYHFYPKGYLKTLDDSLKFTTLTYTGAYHYKNWECTNLPGSGWSPPWTDADGGYHPGYHYCIDPIDYSYVDRHATVSTYDFVEYYNVWMRRGDSTTITFYYDGRGEFYSGGPRGTNYSINDVVARLKGTFKRYYLTSLSQIERVSPANIGSVSPRASVPQLSSPNNRPYISNDTYNDYLKSIEEPSFKGVAYYDDIDGKRREGYVPLSGTRRIYLAPNTVIKRSAPQYQDSWYGAYCRNNNNSSAFCTGTGLWAVNGGYHGQAGNDENSIYVEFDSTPSSPFRIAYYSVNHRSGLSSKSKKIAYVVLDLGDNESDPRYNALNTIMGKSAEQYRNLYGRDFSHEKEKWLKSEYNVQPSDPVIYFFEITYTSYYTPKRFNSDVLGLNENAITWYTNRELTDEAPAQMVADENLVFFTALDRLPKDFPDSCYSNNSNTIGG